MGFIAERLRRQTSILTDLLTRRIRELAGKEGLTSCIKCGCGGSSGLAGLEPGEYTAVGIDGSMDYDELLEMLLFYVCASGFKCGFTVGKEISFHLEGVERDRRLATSASVPLWAEDLFHVAGASASSEEDPERVAERIPFALMTMAELTTALRAVEDEKVRLLLLDRPLSGTYGPLSRDLGLLLRRGESPLFGVETPYGPLTLLDLRIASVLGSGGGWVPKRRRYLPYAAIQRLLGSEGLRARQLFEELGIGEELGGDLVVRLERMHKEHGRALLVEDGLKGDEPYLELQRHVKDYWLRVREVAWRIVERVFYKSSGHPLMMDEGETWLTVIDLNSINAMLIQMLREEALKRGVIVVGIAKDTSSSDFIRAAMPYAKAKGLISGGERLPSFKHDRAFLTILSSVNPNAFRSPWRTLTYDACFTTLVEDRESRTLKAARRVVSMERQFVRGYFQLREFKGDSAVRSPTFLYDRFYNPMMDDRYTVELEVLDRGKPARIYPYWEGEFENPLDNTILLLLSKCDNPEVLEAMGHNQLLYLADKAVKAEVKLMKGLLRGVADLELGALARRQKIFTIARRFRDIRRETEGARERRAVEVEER
ncbi:DNA double-strand break repair nuclease NurA [Candidatus Bathyarchaeota archaeon]|nr:DNA double-strand break repair nuclease NurA [Candidatus Bathyarchaeota archaeon]